MRPKQLAIVGILAAATSACGGTDNGPAFTAGVATETCLQHQKHVPTTAYEGGETAVSNDVLTFLGYYTAHGTQPFCDGKSANSNDRKWAQLYVKLTMNSAKVKTILG